jgi:hypothetical protein
MILLLLSLLLLLLLLFGSGVDTASNRNEYHEYFLRVKAAGVLKSGSLNLLEPSGPVKACNGIALPFLYLLTYCN